MLHELPACTVCRHAEPSVKPQDVWPFRTSRDIEIVTRSCRKWDDRYTLNKEAVQGAEQIIKAGLTIFPGDAFMAASYGEAHAWMGTACGTAPVLRCTAPAAWRWRGAVAAGCHTRWGRDALPACSMEHGPPSTPLLAQTWCQKANHHRLASQCLIWLSSITAGRSQLHD